MVRTTLAIEREVDDTRCIRDMGTSAKRKKSQPSSSFEKKQRTSASLGFQGQGHGQGQVQSFRVCFYSHTYGQEYCLILLHMHVIVCASVCEFRGRNSFKGGSM